MNLWRNDKMMNVDLGPLEFDPPAFDYLGPANAEQRAERKEQRRTERRASLRRVLITIGIDAVFGLGLIVGAVLGSLNPDLVLGVLR